MPPVANATIHALLVAAWTVAGYCAVLFAAHPCLEHAAVAAVMAANAMSGLWVVWPGKAVAS
jgi:hypothetical protein